jgi:putative membrane protein
LPVTPVVRRTATQPPYRNPTVDWTGSRATMYGHWVRTCGSASESIPRGASAGREVSSMDDDDGRDPDYRFTLANERTFLSWIRTALALIAGGVAVVQLVPDFGFPGSRRILGALLAGMGVILALVSMRRWQRVQQAMRRDAELPPNRMPVLLGWALVALTTAVVVLLILER